MGTIKELQPTLLWSMFDQITAIPRPSKQEEKIRDFLIAFGKGLGLETKVDTIGNVIIKKAATNGLEHLPMVALQSHMDMVCEKNSDSSHCFETDAIKTYISDDWVRAQGTTLGADNGIGMAAQMALLASGDVPHCAIECLFTVDEETGLTGANALELGFLESKTLINLDSEDEGELFVGCAGGIDTVAHFDIEETEPDANTVSIKIDVSGLQGGHSGDDIHRGLGNANKILARFLHIAIKHHGFRLSSINSGNLRNAIAREGTMVGTIPVSQKEPIRVSFNVFINDMEEELGATEPKLKMKLGSTDKPEKVFTNKLQQHLSMALLACPHGVIAMSRDIEGLVETSTNLASVKVKGKVIEVTTSQRSSKESAKAYVAAMVESIFALAGAHVKHSDGYPGWTPNLSSAILAKTKSSYLSLFGTEPMVKAIHAGLECGLFLEKFPGLDMISFGPTVKGPHSPDERLNIPSVDKFWKLLCKLVSE
jgi:dipeptidase D